MLQTFDEATRKIPIAMYRLLIGSLQAVKILQEALLCSVLDSKHD
jgi:hypothetical protein